MRKRFSMGMYDRHMPGVGKSLSRRPIELPLGAKAKKNCIPMDADDQVSEFISAVGITKCPEFTPRSHGFIDDEPSVRSTGGRKGRLE